MFLRFFNWDGTKILCEEVKKYKSDTFKDFDTLNNINETTMTPKQFLEKEIAEALERGEQGTVHILKQTLNKLK